MLRFILSACAFVGLFSFGFAQPEKADLPKVVLIGDSIRIGYAPLVGKKLAGKATVISFAANGGDSGNVLKHLDEWVIKHQPALVHLNCGLHDLKFSKKDKKHQIEPAQYEANLKAIVQRIRKGTKATLIFANTTPIHDERHAKRKAAFDRLQKDVELYNDIAAKVMKTLDVPVNDLHGVVMKQGTDKLLGADGTHYTQAGNEKLAEAVAEVIGRYLRK